jgi:hypothetical protein
VERARLEAIGFKFDAPIAGAPSRTRSARATEVVPGLPGVLLGYRSDENVSKAWRVILKMLFLAAIGGAAYGIVTYTHHPLPPTRANVEILTKLEDYTRNAGTTAGNIIPAFLALPGTIGVLEPEMTADDQLKPLQDEDLRQGFCSANIAKQIRYEYPGFYESWPDEKLVRVVLEKYPHYQDRVCILPSSIGVSPDDVVKYRIRDRELVELALLWSRTALIAIVFGMLLMNVYYRALVSRLPSA